MARSKGLAYRRKKKSRPGERKNKCCNPKCEHQQFLGRSFRKLMQKKTTDDPAVWLKVLTTLGLTEDKVNENTRICGSCFITEIIPELP